MVFIASGQSYIVTFAAASVPPLLALAWLSYTFQDELFVHRLDVQQDEQTKGTSEPLPDASGKVPGRDEKELGWIEKAKALGGAFQASYWQALIVVAVLYFGRFDFTFVSLRAQSVCFYSVSRD